MSRIAIITARGGSRRIPKKNIRDFCGKPIIAYSIEAALSSGIFDDVLVSTDSEEIAEIAKAAGASVPFLRSEETSGDFATTADVIAEVLDQCADRGREYDSFCCIYPTAPFVTGEKLQKAATLMEEREADAVVTVVRFSFPPQRSFVEKNGLLAYQWPEYAQRRSQDLEPFYHDAGQFYLVKTGAFRKERTVVPARTCPLILPETEVQDIDTPEDWEIAEIKYRMSHG
jgi:pseudaminic acid cytidylyltransferase